MSALTTGLGLILAGWATAQTLTILHSFAPNGLGSNSDGAGPYGSLILSDNTLYGTARTGGSSGYGTVFTVKTDGSGFANLHSFTASSNGTNSDGAWPLAGLILSGNTLYGTTEAGGSSGAGAVFALNTDGTGFTNLHSFTAINDGAYPRAALILSGNTLYGTANRGGSSGKGTVFAINTDGPGFTNLHSFAGSGEFYPQGALVLSDNILYGTTAYGGGFGTLFALKTNGTGFTNLHKFAGSDGAFLFAGLVLSGNTLYGTATSGGNGYGTVFSLKTDGTGFKTLHMFSRLPLNSDINRDGTYPSCLTLSGDTLYATAYYGGSAGNGTVFSVKTDGSFFTTLYDFTTSRSPFPPINSNSVIPNAGLISSGNILYGTTHDGGTWDTGTVFSFSLPSVNTPPHLEVIPSGVYVILTWPTNAAGFTLQSTTNLISSAVWTTVSPGPDVVNGQYVVTNPISGTQQFYRLSQ